MAFSTIKQDIRDLNQYFYNNYEDWQSRTSFPIAQVEAIDDALDIYMYPDEIDRDYRNAWAMHEDIREYLEGLYG